MTKPAKSLPKTKKEEEVKKLMEIIDEKPNLVKYINTIKGSEKLQIESELDNPLTLQYRDWEQNRKSTRLNSSHSAKSRMPSSA